MFDPCKMLDYILQKKCMCKNVFCACISDYLIDELKKDGLENVHGENVSVSEISYN